MVRTAKSKLDTPHDEGDARATSAFEPISDEERALRKALMERMFARRDEQDPLDIPADQLIREARAEAYGDDAASVFSGGGGLRLVSVGDAG